MTDAAAGLEPAARTRLPYPARPLRRSASFDTAAMMVLVATMFAVSGGLLWRFGLNYDGLQGSAAAKIHPSTYLIVALFGSNALRSGNPVAYVGRFALRRPASLFLLTAAAILFAAIAARGAPGLAGAIDTFMGAGLAMMLLADMDETAMRRIETLVHILMAANALLGLFEFLSGILVFPYRFDGEVFPMDHRSTALQGHPLTNATITAVYVVSLMSFGRLSVAERLRLPAIGLQYAALVAFGGRTALVTAVMLGFVMGLLHSHRALRTGRLPLLAVALATLLLTLVPLAIGGLAAGGFFTAILERFASDGGSAYARVQMFDLFERLPLRDLLVGPDAAYVDSLRRIAGLEWGIENPVIRTLLYQGLILTVLLCVAVIGYFRELARLTAPAALVPMLAFVILINTSESIGGKTTMLTKFAVVMLALHRAVPFSGAAASGRGHRPSPDRGRASPRP